MLSMQVDKKILEDYVNSLFTCRDLKVVAYDMKYPDRDDILYYLLFASRKSSITNIVKDIYANKKKKVLARLYLVKEFYTKEYFLFPPKLNK